MTSISQPQDELRLAAQERVSAFETARSSARRMRLLDPACFFLAVVLALMVYVVSTGVQMQASMLVLIICLTLAASLAIFAYSFSIPLVSAYIIKRMELDALEKDATDTLSMWIHAETGIKVRQGLRLRDLYNGFYFDQSPDPADRGFLRVVEQGRHLLQIEVYENPADAPIWQNAVVSL